MGYLNYNLEKVASAITYELEKRAGLAGVGARLAGAGAKTVAKLAVPAAAPAVPAAGKLVLPTVAPRSGIGSKLALVAKKMMYKMNEKALNYAASGIDPVIAKQVALPMAGISLASKLGRGIFNGIKKIYR